ncbi:MAG: hypothetical protein ACI4QT_03615, partial [Kiritimatiellia bacterium]
MTAISFFFGQYLLMKFSFSISYNRFHPDFSDKNQATRGKATKQRRVGPSHKAKPRGAKPQSQAAQKKKRTQRNTKTIT